MWDPTPVGALPHRFGLDGNDPLPRHVSGFIIRNGRPSLVLGDDHFHIGGSDDTKLDVVKWRLCELVTSYLWFWDWT